MDRTCAGAALDSRLFDEVVNLNDIPNKKEYSFDFIGVFNYFDHLEDPLVCLDKMQDISKTVFVCTHAPNAAGWQHKFCFDLKFIDFLKERYPQKRVSHVSTLFDNKHNPIDFCFIIEN